MTAAKKTKNAAQTDNFKLTRRGFLTALGTSAAGLAFQRISKAAKKNLRPNIIFIMVDDLGKEWISCYGAEDIETPNLDKLARTGMRFENAYSMPQCTPSRATLLTGQYPWRTGWVNHWDVPRWGAGYFDWKLRENMTFARIMKTAGYATAAVGKWQINDFRVTPDAIKSTASTTGACGPVTKQGINPAPKGTGTLMLIRRGTAAKPAPVNSARTCTQIT